MTEPRDTSGAPSSVAGPKVIGIVVHPDRDRAGEVAAAVAASARAHGLELVSDSFPDVSEVSPHALQGCEVVVAVGGDGTMLAGMRVALALDVPILGVNVGRRGFLTELEPDSVDRGFDAIVDGRWTESRRMTLEAVVDGESAIAVNDVVAEKIESQQLVSLAVEVDGKGFFTYHADGVIVSTPTGSTAYNWSAGGPLVDHRLDALIVTPVAPHTVFSKPMVFDPSVRLTLRAVRDREVRVSVDGRAFATLVPESEVVVTRSDRVARFIHVTERRLDQAVRDRFGLPAEDPDDGSGH